MSSGEPLPAHRVALRAAIVGPIAGFVSAVGLLVMAFLGGELRSGALPFLLFATLGGGTWCGLLVLAEEVARHARRALRPPLIALVGASSAALVATAIVWAEALFAGRTPALEDLTKLIDAVTRRPGRSIAMGQAALLPFVAIGVAREVVQARTLLQLAIGALAGLAAFAGCCVFLGPPSGRELPLVLGVFTLLPPVGVLGLALGARAEAWLRARFARWRAAGGDE